MPSKRVRKDSERSTGSIGPPNANVASNAPDACSGAGSSSSGSVCDDTENMKSCCYPSGCPYGEDSLANVNSMVKVICSHERCKMSQFMHSECFDHWEETLLNILRSHGRARSWSEKQRRQNLWTKKGYDLIFRACYCKCKHGHLKKDFDWVPQASADQDTATTKKKNRKKHKDLPSLGGYNGMMVKSKSKPIPNSKDNRMRHSSASSSVSVDQGYISASPGATEVGPSVFSPPTHHHHRPIFSFHNSNALGNRGSNSFHAPSTSPLPEIPDDTSTSPQFTPSPHSTDTSLMSPLGVVFTPPMSPETYANKITSQPRPCPLPHPDSNHFDHMRTPNSVDNRQVFENDVQAMSAYIDGLLRNKGDDPYTMSQQGFGMPRSLDSDPNNLALKFQTDEALLRMQGWKDRSSGIGSFPSVPFNSPTVSGSFLEEYRRRNAMSSSWSNGMVPRVDDLTCIEHRNPGTNAQVLMALRQKEQMELERQDMGKFLMNVMSPEEAKAQVLAMSGNRSRTSSHTEVRMVAMRCTNFTKRVDFSAFQDVLPRQHVNPYRIKMEGEGYGSDDLRNFVLASLSKERCSQMNCVVCGVDMPVYDHFPLVDGTMFLSPEKNERSTRNCFKIKVEGKCEFVHAACIRCMEGLHNIICRYCNTRWEGMHHQLGTLYMFDIFAASPCCQKRLCCKHCGNVVVDIRQGLNYFSEYSAQKACPSCKAVDYHFVHPVTSFQLMGLVFS